MADANLATLAAVRETALGIAPLDGMRQFRFTKESLGFKKETVTSAEVRSDRQVADSVKVFGQPAGTIEFEVSFGMLSPIIEAALMADWVTGSITVGADIAGSTITGSAGDFDNIPVGCIVTIAGSVEDENNSHFRVTAKSGDGSTLTFGTTFVDESGAIIDLRWRNIRNGTELKSDFIERRIVGEGGADFFSVFNGMATDSLEIKIESKKIVMGTLTLVGTSYDESDTTVDPQQVNPVAATGTLTFSANPADGDYVFIGGYQYAFETSSTLDGRSVKVGAGATNSVDNLIAAINGAAGVGTTYAANMTANPFVTAARGSGNSVVLTARDPGADGNLITTTEVSSSLSWAGATLSGGVTGVVGYVEALDDSIVNGSNNLGTVRMDGAVSSEKFKALTLKIANNLRGKDACGTEGNWDIGLGQFNVTGAMNAYFRNSDLSGKSKNHTSFSIDFYLENASGSKFWFYLPAIKPTGEPKIEGVNTDVMIDLSFETIKGGSGINRMLVCDFYDASE